VTHLNINGTSFVDLQESSMNIYFDSKMYQAPRKCGNYERPFKYDESEQ